MAIFGATERRLASRRQILKLAGLTGLALALGLPRKLLTGADAVASRRSSRWSDPGTWGGRVPGKGDVVVISHRVLLDRQTRVAAIIIKRHGELVFHPRRRVMLSTTGNVVVLGKLTMQTKRPNSSHRLVFRGIHEGRFKGGGRHFVSSDVGLWVMGRGQLQLEGTPKVAWARVEGSLLAAASSVTLQEDPIGWQLGDTLVVVPTLAAGKNHHAAQDEATIAGIDGRTIALTTPLNVEHPAVSVGDGKVMTAEVLNLTRTVRIEGTPSGRSHIFIHSRAPQRMLFAQIQNVGPRKKAKQSKGSKGILGRYGIHFHHCGHGSRGSLIQGVVVRDAGNHAFVPHGSHGISFLDCISHNTVEDAFWWDEGDITNDTLWERCVASRVKIGDETYAEAGFMLGAGTGNVSRGCVAVGVESPKTGAGYQWPSKANQKPNVWVFEDCVAHNNAANGIFVWQVDPHHHIVERFVAYRNGQHGVFHGAYSNRYEYRDLLLQGDAVAALHLHANTRDDEDDKDPYQGPITFRRVHADGSDIADWGIFTPNQTNIFPEQPTVIEECIFTGYKEAGILIAAENFPMRLDLRNVTFGGNEFWLTDTCHPDSFILWKGLTLRRRDQPGVFEAKWNASVS
jgi:hypothetical protein